MLFHEFGAERAPALMLVHGAYTTWDRSFGAVIPTLAEDFRVIAVGVDGFDPEENTEYENAVVEAERMVEYIRTELEGTLFAAYGSSLGCHPVFYALLDERVRIRHAVLDGATHLDTGVLTPLMARLEAPTARFLARGGAARWGERLGLSRRSRAAYAAVIYPGATERSYRNTAYSNAAWCRDLRTVPPRPGQHVACWFGEHERLTARTVAGLSRVFPGAAVRTLPGLHHAELLRRPQQLRTELARFVGAPPP